MPRSRIVKDPKWIDVLTRWKLPVSQALVKTINWIHFDIPAPADVAFNLDSYTPGTYDVTVCARDDPDEPKLCEDTDTSNNFKCEDYTLEVLP